MNHDERRPVRPKRSVPPADGTAGAAEAGADAADVSWAAPARASAERVRKHGHSARAPWTYTPGNHRGSSTERSKSPLCDQGAVREGEPRELQGGEGAPGLPGTG